MITLREITKENYKTCIHLKVAEAQKHFVAENWYSLLEAAYEPGLYVKAIYEEAEMIGLFLYDYDPEIPGWSMSRFMVDEAHQHKGYGRQALTVFLSFFAKEIGDVDLYTSVEVDNTIAIALYESFGFVSLQPFSYEVDGILYKEIRMIKQCTRSNDGNSV